MCLFVCLSAQIQRLPLLTILSISLVHVAVGGADQFVRHLLGGRGPTFLRSRDVFLVLPDLVLLTAAFVELVLLRRRTDSSDLLCGKRRLICRNLLTARETMSVCSVVASGYIIGRTL